MEHASYGGMGVIGAPNVKITIQYRDISKEFSPEMVVNAIREICPSAEYIGEGDQKCVVFQVGQEERKVLIRSLSKKGYTLGQGLDCDVEVLTFERDEKGTIEIESKKYFVYYVSKDEYRIHKDKGSGKGSVPTSQKPITPEQFARFFKEGQIG